VQERGGPPPGQLGTCVELVADRHRTSRAHARVELGGGWRRLGKRRYAGAGASRLRKQRGSSAHWSAAGGDDGRRGCGMLTFLFGAGGAEMFFNMYIFFGF
jgi:hypothetical protein